ncbi:hypothetical protein [Parafilimonas terrae]|uniref:Uncharacterized protein n=1 Tax=Parafilimonas terrae TaxID=1465490 RepID=A0A1I5ZD77_9BACT|nr:hypothetical protein [Parafilimonas terrae]SFQ54382.1 hypothetical protein SAMN05444277_11951 [Parafilimonas terrae]
MSSTIKLTLIIFLFATFRECVCGINKSEDDIKKIIANFGDKQLPVSTISLKKNDGYYIGYKNQEAGNYYLAFSLSKNDSFQVCQIVSNKDWDKNTTVNKLILKAAKSLDSLNLRFDTIYDEDDSLNIILVDAKSYAIYPSVSVKSINEIANINKYKQVLSP